MCNIQEEEQQPFLIFIALNSRGKDSLSTLRVMNDTAHDFQALPNRVNNLNAILSRTETFSIDKTFRLL